MSTPNEDTPSVDAVALANYSFDVLLPARTSTLEKELAISRLAWRAEKARAEAAEAQVKALQEQLAQVPASVRDDWVGQNNSTIEHQP